jgi:hypothetical protein
MTGTALAGVSSARVATTEIAPFKIRRSPS